MSSIPTRTAPEDAREPVKGKPARRRFSARWSVKLMDRLAVAVISLGGLGTIVAVLAVGVFLILVAAPLFAPAGAEPVTSGGSEPASPLAAADPASVNVMESAELGWAFTNQGEFVLFNPASGGALASAKAFEQASTAFAIDPAGTAAFGFADGSILFGKIEPVKSAASTDPPTTPGLAMIGATGEGTLAKDGAGIRLQVGEPVVIEGLGRIIAMDAAARGDETVIVASDETGAARVVSARAKKNMLTKKTTLTTRVGELATNPDRGAPDFIRVSGLGDQAFLIWKDGHLARHDLRDPTKPEFAEAAQLTETGAKVTAVEAMIGGSTLLVGDDAGGVGAWFLTRPENATTHDGATLIRGHAFENAGSPVVSLAASHRTRLAAVGSADGSVRVIYAPTEDTILNLKTPEAGAAAQLAFEPKDAALFALGPDGARLWKIAVPHPEGSARTYFGKIWYEGYDKPDYVWQSTGATDAFEPKLSLIPLIFGTIKATFYSMLFGVPLALLAAIFTSEFLHPKWRSRVKPAVELMASLPSVALGFLAALVIAPFIESVLPATLASFITVPVCFLVGAYLWLLLPRRLALRLERWRLPIVSLAVPIGILIAVRIGPVLEKTLFAGDIRLWLDGRIGGSLGGWFYLFLPIGGGASAWIVSRAGTGLRRRMEGIGKRKFTGIELGKLAAGFALTLLIAVIPAFMLNSIGVDIRDGVMGSFTQRNALIVGFVMGFAIIPIIYTISEDALSAVPAHLRSASLAAGATPWQTAFRVVIPTATSGVFSAVMVGLGRAVGETMIVLMAAGNTPVMDWNIFSGFRTLSANLAVELPEAVRDSSHYRTLFLAALALFFLTFVLNTAAEIVRQRFRKRAYQL